MSNQTKKIVNSMSYDYAKAKGEINNEPTLTIPNQSMSVLEMIQQYRRGLPVDQGKIPVYNGEEELPNLQDMDLVERQEYIDAVAEAYADARTRIENARKQLADKEEQEKFEALVNKRVKEIQEANNTATQAAAAAGQGQ